MMNVNVQEELLTQRGKYMVRFCDKEVICIELDKIKRQELLRYFLNDHIGDVICVVDNAGRLFGNDYILLAITQCKYK